MIISQRHNLFGVLGQMLPMWLTDFFGGSQTFLNWSFCSACCISVTVKWRSERNWFHIILYVMCKVAVQKLFFYFSKSDIFIDSFEKTSYSGYMDLRNSSWFQDIYCFVWHNLFYQKLKQTFLSVELLLIQESQ